MFTRHLCVVAPCVNVVADHNGVAANDQRLHLVFSSILLSDICALYSRYSLESCLTIAIDSEVCGLPVRAWWHPTSSGIC
jgi:hypothetical protein